MKSKNPRAKGQYYERKVRQYYEKNGYICYKWPSLRFQKNKDILGADLICYHEDMKKLVFVQVKSHKTDISRAKKCFKELMPGVRNVYQDIWLRNDIVSCKDITE